MPLHTLSSSIESLVAMQRILSIAQPAKATLSALVRHSQCRKRANYKTGQVPQWWLEDDVPFKSPSSLDIGDALIVLASAQDFAKRAGEVEESEGETEGVSFNENRERDNETTNPKSFEKIAAGVGSHSDSVVESSFGPIRASSDVLLEPEIAPQTSTEVFRDASVLPGDEEILKMITEAELSIKEYISRAHADCDHQHRLIADREEYILRRVKLIFMGVLEERHRSFLHIFIENCCQEEGGERAKELLVALFRNILRGPGSGDNVKIALGGEVLGAEREYAAPLSSENGLKRGAGMHTPVSRKMTPGAGWRSDGTGIGRAEPHRTLERRKRLREERRESSTVGIMARREKVGKFKRGECIVKSVPARKARDSDVLVPLFVSENMSPVIRTATGDTSLFCGDSTDDESESVLLMALTKNRKREKALKQRLAETRRHDARPSVQKMR